MPIGSTDPPSSSPLRVAVVEDDAAHAELTAFALERDGHTVARATDLAALAELLDGFDADVIVSEWRLGRADGRAVLRRAAEVASRRGRPLPVVFVTGEDASSLALAEGVDGPVLAKPLHVESLRRAVRRVVAAPARIDDVEPRSMPFNK